MWKIEMAKESYAEVIAAFQLDMALESEGTALNDEIVAKGVANALNDPSKGTYFVAKNESDEVIGSLFLTKEWSDWNNCEYWWIQSVYVSPQYRGRGVYASMYAFVKAQAQENGVPSLRLYVDRGNVRAQKCYQNLGMAECHYLMYEERI